MPQVQKGHSRQREQHAQRPGEVNESAVGSGKCNYSGMTGVGEDKYK